LKEDTNQTGPRNTKPHGRDGKYTQKGDPKGDWLLHIDRTKKLGSFHFKDSNIEPFCLCFAVKEYTCKMGASCRFKHVDFSAMADTQKEAVKAYLATNNAFKLAE
jgi:hypothetical protein